MTISHETGSRLARARDAWWAAAVIVLAATVTIVPSVAAVAGLLIAAQRWPVAALESCAFLVLAARPSLDAFSERRLGLGPLTTNPSVILGIGLVVVASGIELWRARTGRQMWPDRWMRRAHVCLFTAYGVAFIAGSWWYGPSGAVQGGREVIRVTSVVLAFLVVFWWVSENPARVVRGWTYLVVGSLPPLVIATWQLFTDQGFHDVPGINRLQGTLSHPNSLGQYLVPFVLVGVSSSLDARWSKRFLYILGAGVATAFIILTYSRTVLLALASGFVILPFLYTSRLSVRTGIRAVAVIGVICVGTWFLTKDAIRERFSGLSLGRGAWEAVQTGTSENSYEWRLLNWAVLIEMGRAHALTGHGAGMTTVLNPMVNSVNGVPFNAHNDFVRFFFEGGVVGLVAYSSYVVRRARMGGTRQATALGVAASVLALILLSAGNTEISLQTADLYELYGMMALALFAGGSASALRQEVHMTATYQLPS